MRIEGVYQVGNNAPVRIAVSMSRGETVGLIKLLTPGTELSYESAQSHGLPKLLEDLSAMAKRRGWVDARGNVVEPSAEAQ